MKNKFINFKNRVNYIIGELHESTVFLLRMPGWLFGSRFRFCLIGVNLLLAVVFVLQIAAASGTGYELKRLERNIQEISIEQQKIEAEMAAINSLSSLKTRIDALTMVNIPRLKHFNAPATVVAVNSR